MKPHMTGKNTKREFWLVIAGKALVEPIQSLHQQNADHISADLKQMEMLIVKLRISTHLHVVCVCVTAICCFFYLV